MNAGNHIQRARLLMAQDRDQHAEGELRRALLADPEDPAVHAMLALCQTRLDKPKEAINSAGQAIRFAPDSPFCHYAMAVATLSAGELAKARESAEQAISLDPHDPDHHGLLAAIYLSAQRWDKALAAAERGLAIDPEHSGCLHQRTASLARLGRRAEAARAADHALRQDPDDTDAHANRGWAMLHANRPKEALAHFGEAMRLDPENDYARAGLVEALKARYLVYRILLMFWMWLLSLSGRARMGVLVGAYVGYRLLGKVADANPSLAWVLRPILIAYIVFAVLTWLAGPLFNLLLRLNKHGRHALTDRQRTASNWLVGMLLAAGMLALAGWLGDMGELLLAGLFVAVMTMPVATVWHYHGRTFAIRATIIAAIAMCGGLSFMPEPYGGTFLNLWLIGCVGYMIVGPLIGAMRPSV